MYIALCFVYVYACIYVHLYMHMHLNMCMNVYLHRYLTYLLYIACTKYALFRPAFYIELQQALFIHTAYK